MTAEAATLAAEAATLAAEAATLTTRTATLAGRAGILSLLPAEVPDVDVQTIAIDLEGLELVSDADFDGRSWVEIVARRRWGRVELAAVR